MSRTSRIALALLCAAAARPLRAKEPVEAKERERPEASASGIVSVRVGGEVRIDGDVYRVVRAPDGAPLLVPSSRGPFPEEGRVPAAYPWRRLPDPLCVRPRW